MEHINEDVYPPGTDLLNNQSSFKPVALHDQGIYQKTDTQSQYRSPTLHPLLHWRGFEDRLF